MNRRNFLIRSIGAAIVAGLAPSFVPGLLSDTAWVTSPAVDMGAGDSTVLYSNIDSLELTRMLKEVYGSELTYQLNVKNSFLSLIPETSHYSGGIVKFPEDFFGEI